MSKPIHVVFLEPKPLNKQDECFKFDDFTCPSCNGDGYLNNWIGYHGSDKINHPETCQRCNGTGKLTADVVIRWTAKSETL